MGDRWCTGKATVCGALMVFLSVAGVSHAENSVRSPMTPSPARASASPEELSQANEIIRKKTRRRPPRRKRGCQRGTSARYRKAVRRWRVVPKISKPKYRDGYRDLTIHAINLGERVRFFPYLSDGTLDPDALEVVSNVFRDKKTERIHPVDTRLVKLLYQLADHFNARQINLISGFRDRPGEGSESHHSRGAAADIVIPGVGIAALARKARSLGFVGVGLYPNSGFVHVDVREGRSYFWADASGPGKPSCHRRIQTQATFKFDRKWKPQQDEPKISRDKRGRIRGATQEPEKVAVDGDGQVLADASDKTGKS